MINSRGPTRVANPRVTVTLRSVASQRLTASTAAEVTGNDTSSSDGALDNGRVPQDWHAPIIEAAQATARMQNRREPEREVTILQSAEGTNELCAMAATADYCKYV